MKTSIENDKNSVPLTTERNMVCPTPRNEERRKLDEPCRNESKFGKLLPRRSMCNSSLCAVNDTWTCHEEGCLSNTRIGIDSAAQTFLNSVRDLGRINIASLAPLGV